MLIIVLLIFGLVSVFWWKVAQRAEQERRIRAIQLADVDQMPGLQFEHYVARLYRHRGYCAQVTTGSGDLGVDVIASKWGERLAIQVKRYSNAVSRRAVSDAVAGMAHYKCNGAVVVTNSYFSPGAVKLARSTSCQLVDRDILTDWIMAFQCGQYARQEAMPVNRSPSFAPCDEGAWSACLDEAKEKLQAAGLIP